MESEVKHASVGVALEIKKQVDFVTMVLLGKRMGSHGAGSWSFPGGHIDYGESLDQACRRELKEETGMRVGEIRVHPDCPFVNTVFISEQKHYVTLFFEAQHLSHPNATQAEPKLMEPEKCAEWRWFDIRDLPSPLFHPARQFFEYLRAREAILERTNALPEWLLNQITPTPLAAHDPLYIERLQRMMDGESTKPSEG